MGVGRTGVGWVYVGVWESVDLLITICYRTEDYHGVGV